MREGETYIVWTDPWTRREYGPYMLEKCSRELYDEVVRTGTMSGVYGHTINPEMVAFLRVEDAKGHRERPSAEL